MRACFGIISLFTVPACLLGQDLRTLSFFFLDIEVDISVYFTEETYFESYEDKHGYMRDRLQMKVKENVSFLSLSCNNQPDCVQLLFKYARVFLAKIIFSTVCIKINSKITLTTISVSN